MADKIDVSTLSDIRYSLKIMETIPLESDESKKYAFESIKGKVIASVMFRLHATGRGKNIMTLSDKDGKPALSIWCEGKCILAYDGNVRKNIFRYKNEFWFSVWVSLDTGSHTYDLCIDGEKCLSGAEFMNPVNEISFYETGSRMGSLMEKQIFIYRNPVQFVEDSAGGRKIYNVKQYGALADGETLVTDKIQKAIDDCSEKGGGVIYLQGGTFLSGMIELKQGVELYLETDATLKGITDAAAYPTMTSKKNPNWNMIKQGPQKALIYADGVKGIVIQGGGTIDGSGNFPGDYGSESERPSGILLVGCDRSKIQNIAVKDAGMWTIPLVECDGLYMRDVNVSSCWFPNRDGIDLCDCHDVLVENSCFSADDDSVCFKSGHDRRCDNIMIRQMMIISVMANAVKFGTFSYGGFTNCIIRDCIIKDTRHCAMCVEIVDGGIAKNIRFERIEVKDAGSAFFIILGDRGNIPAWGTHRIGSIEEIYFEDVYVENLLFNYGSYISGVKKDGGQHNVRNISFKNIKAEFRGRLEKKPADPPEYTANIYPECDMFKHLPASAYYLRHTEGVVFENCQTVVKEEDVREKIVEV
jgi:hypothetical protein